ncbi:MAG: acetyl-CoA carboxylase biotin carboxylase subunit [candidate division Zixibacteria bacterium]|nr:acetyl-CoA carboxylase biotin carboxylase subunit [candidate division Zixibacteria bacterium]
MTTTIRKILIANRGEIAVRIARGCRDAGIISVAVYSDPDRMAYHVRVADEAYALGGTTSAESYLRQDKIIETARKCGADAIHPGYGFLAENHDFAALCRENGLIFIGPSPEVIALLGDKVQARRVAEKAGLPVVPGSVQNIEQVDVARIEAYRIGYPVLIKAAAGGGGKGMRIVNDPDGLGAALSTAASEAGSAFGDRRVYIEKYISRPRHVEIQILGDAYGNVIHLGERECSIQRRHQKVIEESPSMIVDDAMRAKMGAAAVELAKAAGYVGAGTVEFLVDENKHFYFLEVNTRLQVEHPVTEMVTGLDLVQEQFKIARGEKLSIRQEDVGRRGHAIECRIYAEDAAAGFIPCTGHLSAYQEPSGPGVRVDSGFIAGDDVPVYYDPLIAKLIVWGADRNQAIQRMRRALNEYVVQGIETTISFGRLVMDNESFISGRLSTHFIEDEFADLAESLTRSDGDIRLAAMTAALVDYRLQLRLLAVSRRAKSEENPWKISGRQAGLRKR